MWLDGWALAGAGGLFAWIWLAWLTWRMVWVESDVKELQREHRQMYYTSVKTTRTETKA